MTVTESETRPPDPSSTVVIISTTAPGCDCLVVPVQAVRRGVVGAEDYRLAIIHLDRKCHLGVTRIADIGFDAVAHGRDLSALLGLTRSMVGAEDGAAVDFSATSTALERAPISILTVPELSEMTPPSPPSRKTKLVSGERVGIEAGIASGPLFASNEVLDHQIAIRSERSRRPRRPAGGRSARPLPESGGRGAVD